MLVEIADQEDFNVSLDDLLEQIEIVPSEVLDFVDADFVVVPFDTMLQLGDAPSGIKRLRHSRVIDAITGGDVPSSAGQFLSSGVVTGSIETNALCLELRKQQGPVAKRVQEREVRADGNVLWQVTELGNHSATNLRTIVVCISDQQYPGLEVKLVD